jgi:hypothetical protein
VLTKRLNKRAQPLTDVLQAGARHVRATPTFLAQQAT